MDTNSFKLPKDFFDTVEDERECIHYRAALNPRTTFPELYRNLQIRVHVHLRGLRYSQLGDYCAVFGYDPIANCFERKLFAEANSGMATDSHGRSRPNAPNTSEPTRASKAKPTEIAYSPNYLDDSVFVGVIEVGEKGEGIVLEPVLSVVRLIPLK